MITIDKINIIVAHKKGIDREIVKKVNEFYWKKIKDSLTNLEDTTVSAKGLVNFTISRYLIREKIYDIIFAIRCTRNYIHYTEKRRQFILEEYYSYLRKLLKQRNEVSKIYYAREVARIRKTVPENNEECTEDSGGDNKQREDELPLSIGGGAGCDNPEEINLC